jgi:RRXRR protein
MSYVFVVDTNKKPQNPVHPGEARYLLNAGKAAVLKRFPFMIILKDPVDTQEVDTACGPSFFPPPRRKTGVSRKGLYESDFS